MFVAVAVLAVIVVLTARAVNNISAITTIANRRIEADAQVRPLFDRMTIDFAQMVKRPDVDFLGKGTAPGGPMNGNDRIAFFSMVPGDYPSSGSPSPFSLISYKINSSEAVENRAIFTRLQRMARGLLMNGDASANNGTSPSLMEGPIFFFPISIHSVWTTKVTSNATTDSKHELIGPNVLRFEYYYLLTDGNFSVIPWDAAIAGHNTAAGLRDVAAIVVAVAAVDPKTRVLFDNASISAISGALIDYSVAAGHGPGWLTSQWRSSLDSPSNATVRALPRPAVAAIRVYERFFYLTPTLQ